VAAARAAARAATIVSAVGSISKAAWRERAFGHEKVVGALIRLWAASHALSAPLPARAPAVVATLAPAAPRLPVPPA